ncbi:MAG TPA: CoA ester lyase [Pseudomonas sp.]|nr:CoA ester lyase [Pseudomonas sp.]
MSHLFIRSALFVPGNRAERFAKALASGADAVIVDFEDAVAREDKAFAREQLATFLIAHADARLWVRINAAGDVEHEADLEFCGRHAGVIGVVLPKAETVAQIRRVAAIGKPLWPIIESAQGVLSIEQIAACAGVQRLTLGALDLALDLGLNPDSSGAQNLFDQARFALLLHSRIQGLAPPLDGIYPAFEDDVGLTQVMQRARDMGMGGAYCIHPRQVPVMHAALAPSAAEKAWAQRVIEAAGCGEAAFKVDGQMIDAPVITRARRLLAH